MSRAAVRFFFVLVIAVSGFARVPMVAAMGQMAMTAQLAPADCDSHDRGAAKSGDCLGACVLGWANLTGVPAILIPAQARAWSFANQDATGAFLSPAPTPPRS